MMRKLVSAANEELHAAREAVHDCDAKRCKTRGNRAHYVLRGATVKDPLAIHQL